MRRWTIVILFLSFLPLYAVEKGDVSINGSIDHSGIFALADRAIGATKSDFPYLSNTYLSLGMQSKYVNAGLRLELNPKPLPGYETAFAGAGVGNMYVEAKTRYATFTLGDVYAQFGSGLLLRLYEERALGIDNSLRGGKIVLTPYKGINIQLIGGKQRVYWDCYEDKAFGFDYSQGAVLGANIDLDVSQWSRVMQDKDILFIVGSSYVSKYQDRDTVFYSYAPPLIYRFPSWVGSAEIRSSLQIKGWKVGVEYAYKANDPSVDNNFSYKHGEALLLNLGYSQKGMSVLFQLKRSENMAFRSNRLQRGISAQINNLPAFTTNHTYALAALYPYATQLQGEWAVQGAVRYNFKKSSPLGGKYGTTLSLNAAHVRGIGTSWFAWGKETYYTDIHLEMQKRIAKKWYMNAMYMYQTYNQRVVEGHGDLVRAHILVADMQYKLSRKVNMRAELQYLYTRQAEGQWIYGLYELALFNRLTLSASDMYNIRGEHYYMAAATYQQNSHRLQVGFGRTRAGYNCSGGICRYVPAEKGATITYNYSF